MIALACSISLLVIVAGMFLLAKTQKDNLSNFFKYVAYFVIVAGFLHLIAGGIAMTFGMMMKHYGGHDKHHENPHKMKHGGMEMCPMGMQDCGNMEMCGEKCMMMKKGHCGMGMQGGMQGGMHGMGMHGMEKCGQGGMGGMMKEDCCMEKKMVIRKDSVIKK